MTELQTVGIVLFIIAISILIIIISINKYKRLKFNENMELRTKERKLIEIWFKRNYKKYSENELNNRFHKYIMKKDIPSDVRAYLFSQYSTLKHSEEFKEPIQHIVE